MLTSMQTVKPFGFWSNSRHYETFPRWKPVINGMYQLSSEIQIWTIWGEAMRTTQYRSELSISLEENVFKLWLLFSWILSGKSLVTPPQGLWNRGEQDETEIGKVKQTFHFCDDTFVSTLIPRTCMKKRWYSHELIHTDLFSSETSHITSMTEAGACNIYNT